jgi:arylsulfatase A-like enzyme
VMVKIVEMDESVTLKAQLEEDVGPVILLNKFTVKPEDTDEFLKVFSLTTEMFNNTAVFMDDWKAVKNEPPVSDGKWYLYNITADIGENTDLASQHPEILQKLLTDYDKFVSENIIQR